MSQPPHPIPFKNLSHQFNLHFLPQLNSWYLISSETHHTSITTFSPLKWSDLFCIHGPSPTSIHYYIPHTCHIFLFNFEYTSFPVKIPGSSLNFTHAQHLLLMLNSLFHLPLSISKIKEFQNSVAKHKPFP